MLAAAFERWRSFVPSSAVVGHKTQTRLGGPSVHLCSGRAAERAVSDNASGPVPPHRPPLRPVGASLSSKVNRQDKTRQDGMSRGKKTRPCPSVERGTGTI